MDIMEEGEESLNSSGQFSFGSLEKAYLQEDCEESISLSLQPSTTSKQGVSPKTSFQDYSPVQQPMMGSPPQQLATEKGLPPLNPGYAANQGDADQYNMTNMENYMSMMNACNTYGGSDSNNQMDYQDTMPMVTSSIPPMNFQWCM